MKAARFYRSGEPIRVEEVPIPDIDRGEVLVRVRRSGTNGGDVGLIRGVHDATLSSLPMTIGHDGCGEIAEVGPGVYDLNVGDRVLVRPGLSCGVCGHCRSEREDSCLYDRTIGFVTLGMRSPIFDRYNDGLWAEYCRVPATNIERLEPGDNFDTMSLVSQMAVGFRALKRARLSAGETLIINGATGITGIPTVLAALLMGAGMVIAVARNPDRLARLKQVDSRRIETISVPSESIREKVNTLTQGRGAHVLVDLNPGTLESTIDCLYCLEHAGRASLLAGNREVLQVPYLFFLNHSIEISSCHGRNYEDIHKLAGLARRGLIDLSPIKPMFFKLEEVNEAIQAVANKSAGERVWPMMRID